MRVFECFIPGSLKKSFSYRGLEEIAVLVDELEKLDEDLDSALQQTGCELHLKRGREGASMQRVRELLPSRWSPLDVRHQAYNYSIDKRYPSSLILYRISTEMYLKQDHSSDDVAEWMKRLADGASEACVKLSYEGSASQQVAVEYGAKYIEQLLVEFRSRTDLDPAVLSITESFCQQQIDKIYRQSNDYDHSNAHARDVAF